jgi:pimeloyl-ACP methyl ester carboxylesterase
MRLRFSIPTCGRDMNRTVILAAVLILISAGAHAQPSAPAPTEWTDQSLHEVNSVSVAPGVDIEVLDWGGPSTAMPLVFLAGLTNNAHAFDDFAPRFTGGFRVIGITRRGHGASSWPESGYDFPTLTQDIWRVLDDLNVPRAIFVGHSIAGMELNLLAVEQPDRVAGSIYIDAAYDHTRPRILMPLCVVSRGPDAAQAFLRRLKNPTAFTNTQQRVGNDGVPQPYVSQPAIPQILAGISPPDYSGVQAPALAVYYLPARIEDEFPNASAECVTESQRYYYSGPAAFADGAQRATIVTIPHSQHNIHLVTPDELELVMKNWLNKLPLQ